MSESFPVKNVGELTHYMGCAFASDGKNGTLSMSQESYVDKPAERFEVIKIIYLPACPTVELDARRELRKLPKSRTEKW